MSDKQQQIEQAKKQLKDTEYAIAHCRAMLTEDLKSMGLVEVIEKLQVHRAKVVKRLERLSRTDNFEDS